MKKQIYRKESFPYSYTWNNKVYFIKYAHNSEKAMYDVNSNITGEVLGEIIVTKTNAGLFKFNCSSFEQSFAVRDIQRGFDFIAKNLYNNAKLKYGKEFWGEFLL